jgi:hypothetical protein
MIAHGSECVRTHNVSYHVFAKDVGIHVTQNNFMFFVLSHFKDANNASTLYFPKDWMCINITYIVIIDPICTNLFVCAIFLCSFTTPKVVQTNE